MKLNKIIIGLMLFFINDIFYAQNFNDAYRLGEQTIDFDARTLSMGNSTIASFGNFSSSLINPAGLGTIKRDVLSLSFNSNKFENATDFFGNTTTANKNNSSTNQFGLVLPLPTKKGSAVLAFGYNQIRDFNSTLTFKGFNNGNNSMVQDLTNSEFISDRELAWELGVNRLVDEDNDEYSTSINGKLYQSGDLNETGFVNNWIMSGAFEVSKDLFIGATFNIISGDYKSKRTFNEDDLDDNLYNGYIDPQDTNTLGFELFYLEDVINWDINGWDFRLGLLYNLNSNFSFGAMVKFPTSYTIKEKYTFYGESQFTNTIFTINDNDLRSEYEISTPMELSGGFSASFSLLKINASAKFIDYSQLEFVDDFDKTSEIKEVFESTINWNFGAEFTLPNPAMKIRGGFIYKPSPYINDDSEFDRKYFTVGLGFPITKKLLFDFAYISGSWRNYSDNYGVNQSRTFQDIKVNNLVFSVSYIFM